MSLLLCRQIHILLYLLLIRMVYAKIDYGKIQRCCPQDQPVISFEPTSNTSTSLLLSCKKYEVLPNMKRVLPDLADLVRPLIETKYDLVDGSGNILQHNYYANLVKSELPRNLRSPAPDIEFETATGCIFGGKSNFKIEKEDTTGRLDDNHVKLYRNVKFTNQTDTIAVQGYSYSLKNVENLINSSIEGSTYPFYCIDFYGTSHDELYIYNCREPATSTQERNEKHPPLRHIYLYT